MDTVRHNSWVRYYSLLALVVLVGLTRATTPDYTFNSGQSTGVCGVQRGGYLKLASGTGMNIYYKLTCGSYVSGVYSTFVQSTSEQGCALCSNGSYSFTGLTSTSGDKTLTGSTTDITLAWGTTSTALTHTIVVPSGSPTIVAHFVSGVNNANTFTETPYHLVLDAVAGTTTDNGEAYNNPPKYAKGYLLLDNRSGAEMTIPFGSESLDLQPGYNSFPFYGQVDSNGFPDANSGAGDWPLAMATDPATGTVYWGGRLTAEGDLGIQWAASPDPLTIIPPSSGTKGPTIEMPGTGGVNDYVPLPPEDTKPPAIIPPNTTPPPGQTLPPGVTQGTSGGLPSGTISGGTTYLPPGVSAGSAAGNAQSGSSGTGGIQQTPGRAGDINTYTPGETMAGLDTDGQKAGAGDAAAAKALLGSSLQTLGDKAKNMLPSSPFWNSPGEGSFGGNDNSWAHFTVPIVDQQISVNMPDNLISLIRSILLWVVRVWFVIGCIRLLMK